MNGTVIVLCVLSGLLGAGLAYLIMTVRISRMQHRFRDAALLIVRATEPRSRKPRKVFKQQMTIEQRTEQLRAQLKM